MEVVLSRSRLLFNLSKGYNFYLNRGKLILTLHRRQKLLIGLLPFIPNVAAEGDLNAVKSEVLTKKEDESTKKEDESRSQENKNPITEDVSGWDRLKAVYQTDEYGNSSKELTAVIQSTFMSLLIGILYGGTLSSREAFQDFMDRNQATLFENHIDAKRRLTNHVTWHFMKGGAKWGVKITAFTGGFMLFVVSIAAYRGHSSILDYTLSGALTGSLIRFRHGPPHMLIGGALGGFLGLLCGITTKGLLSLTGTSLDEVLSVQYEMDKSRRRLFDNIVSRTTEESLNQDAVELAKQRKNIVDEKKEF